MARVENKAPPYLSSTQQDLLLAALSSNKPKSGLETGKTISPDQIVNGQRSSVSTFNDNNMFASPQQVPGSGTLGGDDTPFADYLDGDNSFDFDGADLDGQQMIGDYPEDDGLDFSQDFGKHDKRKISVSEDEDDDQSDPKRKEGEDRQAKKPGRKPIMAEPTTKRKAQNRAAQRAFRERKEKHLKDLETKVDELTKSSQADKHENGLLKAQVDRLQVELRDYRKRLSSDASRNRSPTSVAANKNPIENSTKFAFEFPTFGQNPGTVMPVSYNNVDLNVSKPGNGTQKAAQPTNRPAPNGLAQSRQNSGERSFSPRTVGDTSSRPAPVNRRSPVLPRSESTGTMKNSSNNSLDKPLSGVDKFASLFSPGILNGVNYGTENNDYGFQAPSVSPPTQQNVSFDNGTDSTSGLSRVFRFNSGSISSQTDSPSQSSLSQFNVNSSCDTSPEPCHPSPPKDTSNNPKSDLTLDNISNVNALSALSPGNGIDWFAAQNGGQFDPVLFGDYRESQEAIIGDGDFNNGFFNDAFPFDFGSPLNFDLLSPNNNNSNQQQQVSANQTSSQTQAPVQSQASKNCLANAEKVRDGVDDDYGLPATVSLAAVDKSGSGKMLSCNTIWNHLQSNPDFQEGKFDIDGLCSELRAKAKCSESGVIVPADDVDLAFRAMAAKAGQGGCPRLSWEETHVDDAIKKLGGSSSFTSGPKPNAAPSNWGGMGL